MSKTRSWMKCWTKGKVPSTSLCSSAFLGRNSTVKTFYFFPQNLFMILVKLNSICWPILLPDQVLILKTPYLLPSNFLIQTGLALSIRMSKSLYNLLLTFVYLHLTTNNCLISAGSNDYWWTRPINSQQRRFVSPHRETFTVILWIIIVTSCIRRWIRPSLWLPLTQLVTSTTSPSATSSHMEMRKKNHNKPL